jgi:hypothetical protein
VAGATGRLNESQMASFRRFTTQYRGDEDRILLTGEVSDGETVSLWLTQRLLLKTLPVLVDWLQKNNPVDLKTRDNSAQAREMAQVFTRKPVQAQAAAVPANPGGSTGAKEEDCQNNGDLPVLVLSVDVNLNPKLLRLRFRQTDDELASLALNGSQLRQWLAVLHVLWKNAGWPGQLWPHWLRDDVKLVSNETRGSFH